MTVHKYLPDGETVTIDERGRYRATRKFRVTNLTPGDNLLFSAMSQQGIPRYGDSHPSRAELTVSGITASPYNGDTGTVDIMVDYTPADSTRQVNDAGKGTFTFGATAVSVPTQVDNQGRQIVVKHVYQERDSEGRVIRREATQVGEVEVQIPLPSVSASRRESRSPREKQLRYVGKVNSVPWLDYPARTVLCTRIDGTTQDDGLTWDVTYEFSVKPDTWDVAVAFIGDDGKPEKDLVVGEGLKVVEVYPKTDFTELRLRP